MSDINLTAIRRDDPYADSIVTTASQVAVYKFNSPTNDWEKLDIEGAFFIYSRFAEPKNSLLVMNRLSKKNFMEPIIKELEIECQLPFILFRNDQLNIYGIWFYDPAECKRIFNQLEYLIKTESARREAEAAAKSQKPQNQDVLSLLMKAKDQQKKDTGAKKTANANSSQPINISNGRPDGSLSVAALFGRSHDKKEIQAKDRSQATQNYGEKDQNFLRRLMSVPSDFEISNVPEMPSAGALEKDLKEVLKIGTSQGLSGSHAKSVPNLNSQPFIPGIFPLEKSPVPNDLGDGIPLMSPMIFSDVGKIERSPEKPQQPPVEKETTRPLDLLDLLTPQSLVSSSPVDPDLSRSKKLPAQPFNFEPIDIPEVTPLTKQQLTQALIHLLKTDSDFVSALHGAYLQSLERPRLGKNLF